MVSWNHEEGVALNDKLVDIYQQLFAFAEECYGISVTRAEKDALLVLQLAACNMKGRSFPENIPVSLDIVAYFKQFLGLVSLKNIPQGFRPLADFPSGEILLPDQLVRKRMGFHQTSTDKAEFPFRIQGLESL